MNPLRDAAASFDEEQHDLGLVRWMLSLSPQQRLAELESRLAFFHAARRDVAQLPDDPVHTESPRG